MKTLAVVSCNGHKRVFRNINRTHRLRRLDRQLRHLQRELSRKQKGSKNRMKAQERLRKQYGRLSNIRREYTHQVTRKLVDMKPRVIVLEDLNVSAMLKNHYLSKAVREQNLYMFRKCIEQKAAVMGIEVMYADKFYPSSKTCSRCGHTKKGLRLSERLYRCEECGYEIDRDYNAALNLESLAVSS